MTTNVEVPGVLDETVEGVYEEYGYASKSEMVRDSIRRHLTELGEWPPGGGA